jgi:hypothetical protein
MPANNTNFEPRPRGRDEALRKRRLSPKPHSNNRSMMKGREKKVRGRKVGVKSEIPPGLILSHFPSSLLCYGY